MGWRTLLLDLDDEPTPPLAGLLTQIVEVATFLGIEGFLEEPDAHPGQWEFTLDANSSFLDTMSPVLAEHVAQIARDIDPSDEALGVVADEVRRQLEEQLVGHMGLQSIQPARQAHRFLVRSTGDASPEFQRLEVDLHHARLEQGVEEYLTATGPTAWRDRHRLQLQIRVDALGLAGSARRLRRTAVHLAGEVSEPHLADALARFDAAVPHLISLRDISEHIDEYAIGAGRRDGAGVEAGPVFDLEIDRSGAVTLSAREHSMEMGSAAAASRSLAACVQASVDHYMLYRAAPGFADFEFVREVEGEPTVIAPEDEGPEHLQIRQAMASMRVAEPDPKPCPHCHQPL